MDPIYVQIVTSYNSDASKAPKKFAEGAKTKMLAAIKRALTKASGFTTDDKAARRAAFVVRVKVSDIIFTTGSAAIKLTGELLKHPNEMISTSLTAGSRADGNTSDSAILEAVDAAAEGMMGKVIPVMTRLAAS